MAALQLDKLILQWKDRWQRDKQTDNCKWTDRDRQRQRAGRQACSDKRTRSLQTVDIAIMDYFILQIFHELDINGDGVLTIEEVNETNPQFFQQHFHIKPTDINIHGTAPYDINNSHENEDDNLDTVQIHSELWPYYFVQCQNVSVSKCTLWLFLVTQKPHSPLLMTPMGHLQLILRPPLHEFASGFVRSTRWLSASLLAQ